MKPVRIQRKRIKGWRMPENTVSVTRPGKYGNPFAVNKKVPTRYIIDLSSDDYFHFIKYECGYVDNTENAIYLFKKYVLPTLNLESLRGKNLACFCNLNSPCHADILLQEANK